MRHLDRAREYLMWYEAHRDRWVAVPVSREGGVIMDSEYDLVVVLDL
jgi:hypothetical protein